MSAEALRRVQELDERLATLSDQERSARLAVERDPALERHREVTGAAQREQEEADAALRESEAELRTVSDRARSLHRTLYGGSVHNPNELLELQHELEALQQRLAEVEDRALAAMERAEAATADAERSAGELTEQERARGEQMAPLTQQLHALQAAIESLSAERELALAAVPAAERALYARVAARHRPAVVSIVGDVCGGCHMPLSNDERRAVRSGERVVQCSSCDRILIP